MSGYVASRRPKSYQEAVEHAMDFNEHFKKNKEKESREVNYLKSYRSRMGGNSKANDKKNLNNNKNFTCYGCGGTGHKKSECYKTKNNKFEHNNEKRNYNENKSLNKNRNEEQQVVCTFCGKAGHIENDCWQKMSILNKQIKKELAQEDSAMEINNVNKPRFNVKSVIVGISKVALLQGVGKINNNNVRVVFDTDAECTCVSSRIVEKYNLKLSNEKVIITVANSKTEEARVTEPVILNIFDTYVEMPMIVIDEADRPILIGLDWMSEVNAIIDTKNRKIKFGSKSYLLVGENEDDGYIINQSEIEINECRINNVEVESDEDLGFIDHVYENESKTDRDLLKLTEELLNIKLSSLI